MSELPLICRRATALRIRQLTVVDVPTDPGEPEDDRPVLAVAAWGRCVQLERSGVEQLASFLAQWLEAHRPTVAIIRQETGNE